MSFFLVPAYAQYPFQPSYVTFVRLFMIWGWVRNTSQILTLANEVKHFASLMKPEQELHDIHTEVRRPSVCSHFTAGRRPWPLQQSKYRHDHRRGPVTCASHNDFDLGRVRHSVTLLSVLGPRKSTVRRAKARSRANIRSVSHPWDSHATVLRSQETVWWTLEKLAKQYQQFTIYTGSNFFPFICKCQTIISMKLNEVPWQGSIRFLSSFFLLHSPLRNQSQNEQYKSVDNRLPYIYS